MGLALPSWPLTFSGPSFFPPGHGWLLASLGLSPKEPHPLHSRPPYEQLFLFTAEAQYPTYGSGRVPHVSQHHSLLLSPCPCQHGALLPSSAAPCPSLPGDSLSYHSGQKFSTFDRDQDLFVQNCAALSSGAFWFRSCHFANLNGFYLGGSHLSYANGINWAQWKGFYYSLKRTEMKIRRT